MKTKWSAEVPKSEGWYWCQYKGKNGLVLSPCYVCILSNDTVINTFKGGSFFKRKDDWNNYFQKERQKHRLKFGDRIKEPA